MGVFIAKPGWLVHTANIKAALQEPKRHPSPQVMSKIVDPGSMVTRGCSVRNDFTVRR